jgi:cardiolipin synthase A/B
LMVRLDGPIVRELDAVFVTDWYSETQELLPLDTTPVVLGTDDGLLDAQVLPSGPSFDNDNNLKLFTFLLHSAQRRISITSPYFVPDESTLMAIVTAASRGVEVELFVSAIGDQHLVYHAQRSYYEALLRAGVAIYLYRAPTVLHSKHFSIDDDVAVIGSSNMDIRSFSLNMEVSVMLHGSRFVDAMRTIEDGYRAASDRLTLDDWMKRPLIGRINDSLARLTASLQ